jgi:hypothetical protein
MDILGLLFGFFVKIWFLLPVLFIALIFKTRWFKGVFGEFLVNRLLSQLPELNYKLVKNVTLPTETGTTQIDHIVVSKFGIFVIETKNMKGWIFGTKNQKQWTQKIYRHTSKFQNPLHQNFKHIKTLESLLDIELSKLHSLIVFVGDSTFKTNVPDNVIYAKSCLDFIQKFRQPILSNTECGQITAVINDIKLQKGIVTDLKHRKHVKELVASKINEM